MQSQLQNWHQRLLRVLHTQSNTGGLIMDIKTKFNIGDTAYFLNEYNCLVECIAVSISQKRLLNWSPGGYYTYQDLEYLVEYTDCELLKKGIKAGKLFATPEALFDNLKNNVIKYEQTVED